MCWWNSAFASSACATTARSRASSFPSRIFRTRLRTTPNLSRASSAAGYRFVTLDLAGFRSGSLNGAGSAVVVPMSELLAL